MQRNKTNHVEHLFQPQDKNKLYIDINIPTQEIGKCIYEIRKLLKNNKVDIGNLL